MQDDPKEVDRDLVADLAQRLEILKDLRSRSNGAEPVDAPGQANWSVLSGFGA